MKCVAPVLINEYGWSLVISVAIPQGLHAQRDDQEFLTYKTSLLYEMCGPSAGKWD